jgi:hypothetical protein
MEGMPAIDQTIVLAMVLIVRRNVRSIWFDEKFCRTIFGQVLAKIHHEGGSCMVAFVLAIFQGRPGYFFRSLVKVSTQKKIVGY